MITTGEIVGLAEGIIDLIQGKYVVLRCIIRGHF